MTKELRNPDNILPSIHNFAAANVLLVQTTQAANNYEKRLNSCLINQFVII